MSVLMILNRLPYDGTDVTWNALRLASQLNQLEHEVHLFLMNDAVELARESCVPVAGYDQDLQFMLKGLIGAGVQVQACGTCLARCGLHKNEPYFQGVNVATMVELATLVGSAENVLTF